jgi:hypothetical protein
MTDVTDTHSLRLQAINELKSEGMRRHLARKTITGILVAQPSKRMQPNRRLASHCKVPSMPSQLEALYRSWRRRWLALKASAEGNGGLDRVSTLFGSVHYWILLANHLRRIVNEQTGK